MSCASGSSAARFRRVVLSPERVLMEQSGLSRAVVRDGLRELKHQGLIRTSPGRHGGSIVSRPTPQDLTRSMDIFVLSNGLAGAPELRETREVVEPWCAAFAATRRTEADLDLIDEAHRRCVERVDDHEVYLRASQRWHVAVSQASHHPLLSAIMHLQLDDQIRAARLARNSTADLRRAGLETHRTIAEAIRRRDPKEAFRLMSVHCTDDPDSLLDRLESEARATDV